MLLKEDNIPAQISSIIFLSTITPFNQKLPDLQGNKTRVSKPEKDQIIKTD